MTRRSVADGTLVRVGQGTSFQDTLICFKRRTLHLTPDSCFQRHMDDLRFHGEGGIRRCYGRIAVLEVQEATEEKACKRSKDTEKEEADPVAGCRRGSRVILSRS